MLAARIETLAGGGLEEIKALLPGHHEELAVFRDRMSLNPQYPLYLAREEAGQVLFAVLRDEGRMVGYYVAFIAPGLHYGSTLTGTMDICYVAPEYRRNGGGLKLFLLVEEELRWRHVAIWYSGSKVASAAHPGMEKLLTGLGFMPVDLYFAKWLQA